LGLPPRIGAAAQPDWRTREKQLCEPTGISQVGLNVLAVSIKDAAQEKAIRPL